MMPTPTVYEEKVIQPIRVFTQIPLSIEVTSWGELTTLGPIVTALNAKIPDCQEKNCGFNKGFFASMNYPTIFDYEWWIDAATAGNWSKAEFDDGKILTASLIYSCYRVHGINVVGMPHLARVMQPTIRFYSVEARRNLSHIVRGIQGVAEQFPSFGKFVYTLPPDSNLELAFQLAGYTVTTDFTFRSSLDPSYDPWITMDQKVRYNIKSAYKRLQVIEHHDIERYINLSKSFIHSRALNDPTNYGALRRILNVSIARCKATILSAVDTMGDDVASAAVLMDDKYLYYWMNCRSPASNDGSANSLLIWTAMQRAKAMGLIFDIDGYSKMNTGLFLSRFGLLASRRSTISQVSNVAALRIAAISQMKNLVGDKFKQRLMSVQRALHR